MAQTPHSKCKGKTVCNSNVEETSGLEAPCKISLHHNSAARRFDRQPGRRHCQLFFTKWSSAISLLWLLLVLCNNEAVCQGALFISGPRNQTITEGESALFECVYKGSDLVPSWRINSTIYFNTQLPNDFEVNEIDYSLTVQNVPAEWNFTALQCVVGTQFSDRGYLFVIPNSTTCFNCVPSSSTSPPTYNNQSATLINEYTANAIRTDYPATGGSRTHGKSSSVLLAVIVAPVLVAILLLCLIGAIVLRHVLKKRHQASKQTANNIPVKENVAYSATEQFRKHIRVARNPAYEMAKNTAANRAHSPQA